MDRRSFFAGAGMLALAGCTKCKLPLAHPIASPLSDAHAHFFNAADLPVRGFLRHVIAPRWFKDLPGIALALGDLAGELAKRLSITARSELAQLGRGAVFGSDDPDAEEFGRNAADYQERVINARGYIPLATRTPETNLADSHLQLALLLGVVRFPRSAGSERDAFRRGIEIDADHYAEIASEDAPSEGRVEQEADVPEAYRLWAGQASIDIRTIIRWVFLMCKSRCSHVLKYRAVVEAPGHQVGDAANLLVDYDAWLSDRPLDGSDHADQARYWTRYAEATKGIEGATRLHTFAGFCPLKDVEEQLSNEPENSFDRMKTWVAAGRSREVPAQHRIAGFKIYPPMGFSPDTNSGMVLPRGRAADGVRARWRTNKWDMAEIGERLDTSLERFFRYCAERDVPIITHAAMSNSAMAGAEQMASPHHWIARAQTVAGWGLHPLRVSLGHFDMGGLNHMTLERALRMNHDPSTRTNIFFDLSYDDSILDGNPKPLLDALAASCRHARDEGDYIMFGTDWIMLGQQPSAPDYLKTVYRAASEHDFWRDKTAKLFRTNFLRFLGPSLAATR